jgi:metal-responsive CopG/Arc/MetJ family transcriptional regulator
MRIERSEILEFAVTRYVMQHQQVRSRMNVVQGVSVTVHDDAPVDDKSAMVA